MKLRPKKCAGENASRLLPRLAEEVFKAGDKAVAGDLTPEKAHRFRIIVKRFRYTLEYFRPCYGSATDSYLEMLKAVQQVLGELNDCRSSQELYQGLLKVGNPPTRHKKLFSALEKRQADLMDKFREEWRRRFENPTMRRKFLRYLARPLLPKQAT